MTVSSSTNKIIGTGNGLTTAWPFSFKVLDPDHLVVTYTDVTGGETTLDAGAYAVVLNADQDASPGGTVTYGPAIADGTKLTILRVVPYTQSSDIKNQGGFFPEVLERMGDLLAMQIQQVKEQLARAFKLSPSQAAIGELEATDENRANTILGFGPNGLLTLFTGLSSTAVSLAMQPVIAAASLAAGRTAMGAAGLADNNTFTGANEFDGAVSQVSADAGASAGPTHTLHRDSASPAAGDALGERKYTGKDGGGGTDTYGRDVGVILSPTAGAEHGIIRRGEIVAGAEVTQRIWHSMPRRTAASSAALVVDGIPSIANEIRISFDLLNATNAANLVLTPRKSTGTDITTLSVGVLAFAAGPTAFAASAITNQICGPVSNNASTGGAAGTITFSRVQSGRHKTFIFAIQFHNSSDGIMQPRLGGGHAGDAAALTGVKLAFDSGNITEGYMDVSWRE